MCRCSSATALIARMLIWSRGRTALLDAYENRWTFDKAKPLLDNALATRPRRGRVLFPSAVNVPPVLVHYATSPVRCTRRW